MTIRLAICAAGLPTLLSGELRVPVGKIENHLNYA
jgi:hypothetical protein